VRKIILGSDLKKSILVPHNGLFFSQECRAMFELAESRQTKVSDYHRIYTLCLENSLSYMFLNFYSLSQGQKAKKDFSFEREFKYYKRDRPRWLCGKVHVETQNRVPGN